ncbi:sugar ABC transporter ATP-binding protein [Microbacterium sp. STN6]|uniref:sugar ABC transporter ATP-binding protein n=1 Tax=Microbacterium sp. STN6 TaxID=2995588 RepID=UPI0022609D41|nr:sugar ABC transporter ATP-binding protein [Microbacterium sp. STN6]MCX7521011.1 sugar ABC transporter ATP-binding protein [Microbacterium sp. STN6]
MSERSGAWLQVRGLSKHFGGANALSAVDVDIHRGEVHGLVGANGAGKSTFIKCLACITTPDEGTVSLDGEPLALGNPHTPEDAGFAFIHQELNLVPHFDAIQNILLGVPKPRKAGFTQWRQARAMAIAAAERIGVDFPLNRRVDELTVAQRWLVMIGKALVRNASLVVMDEPTASLSAVESDALFRIIRDLSRSGVAILYVSHRLDEVLDLSDRITVFRDGRVTKRADRGELDKAGLIQAIVGRAVPSSARSVRAEIDRTTPLFEARNVRRLPMVKDVSFTLFPGEVLGLGGLVGAGRTETARLAFHADKLESGSFLLEGTELKARGVADAVKAGIALIPEERRSEGLILEKSVQFNMSLAALEHLRALAGLPFLSAAKQKTRTLEMIRALSIKTTGPSQAVGRLSGGNQQKALIARWLIPGIKVVFFDEPSRGVDIGARQEIHQAIRDLAERGIGTIVISSDVEELAMLCDRVVVLREGEVSGEAVGDEITEQAIIQLSYAPVHEAEGGTR